MFVNVAQKQVKKKRFVNMYRSLLALFRLLKHLLNKLLKPLCNKREIFLTLNLLCINKAWSDA